MEGEKIYENSLKEINRLKKGITTNSVTINFNNLDTTTAGELKDAIYSVLNSRQKAVTNVLTKAN